MLPRSLDWHHVYLALATGSASLCLAFWVAARNLVLPLALVTMLAFSLTALANARDDRTVNRGRDVSTGLDGSSGRSSSSHPLRGFEDDDRI